MTTLHLGVTELSYAHSGKTTGDVAEILEAKYHIVEHFWQMHQREIVGQMTEAIVDSFEAVLIGAPPPNDPYAAATTQVEKMFNTFLDQRELEGIGYPGIPTGAALKGVNHRLKRPYVKKNPRRSSFIDTGLYESSFRVWVD